MRKPYNSWAKCHYLSAEWQEVRDRHEWNGAMVIAKWRERRSAALEAGFDHRTIKKDRLDNPFVSELALRVIMSDRELRKKNTQSRNKYGRFTSVGTRQLRRAA